MHKIINHSSPFNSGIAVFLSYLAYFIKEIQICILFSFKYHSQEGRKAFFASFYLGLQSNMPLDVLLF